MLKAVLVAAGLLVTGCASFEIRSMPPEVSLVENEEEVAKTPFSFSLFAGERRFTARKEGYVEQIVEVSPLDRQVINIVLETVRRTTIYTIPTGALVYDSLSEKMLGRTSLELRLDKPESVRIDREGYEPVSLTLVPNQSYKIELKPLEGFREIKFTSDPSGAAVHNRAVGDLIARTPISLSAEEGTEFEFRLDGYKPSIVMVNKRSPKQIHVKLVPISRVTIESFPGAQVYRAGGQEPIGSVPYTEQIENDRIYEVRMEGCYPVTVAASPENSATIQVELKKFPYKVIDSVPAGATIYRYGRNEVLGTCPLKILVESDRLVEIGAAGHRSRIIGIGPDSPERLTVALDREPRDDILVEGLQQSNITTF